MAVVPAPPILAGGAIWAFTICCAPFAKYCGAYWASYPALITGAADAPGMVPWLSSVGWPMARRSWVFRLSCSASLLWLS